MSVHGDEEIESECCGLWKSDPTVGFNSAVERHRAVGSVKQLARLRGRWDWGKQ